MSVTLHTGDCLDVLPALPETSAHCIVTSPPYFGLRDYGIPPSVWPEIEFAPMAGLPAMRIPQMTCCLGLEPEPWAFVGHMVHVFRLARRVLRDDGTLWLNLGDSYATHAAGKVADPMRASTLAGVRTQEVANESSRAAGMPRAQVELAAQQLPTPEARRAGAQIVTLAYTYNADGRIAPRQFARLVREACMQSETL